MASGDASFGVNGGLGCGGFRLRGGFQKVAGGGVLRRRGTSLNGGGVGGDPADSAGAASRGWMRMSAA